MARSRTGTTLGVNLVLTGCSILTSVQLSRALGPSGRGEVVAILLWPILLVVFFSTGLIPAVLYHAAGRRDAPGEVLGTSLAMSTVQGAVAVAVGYLAMPYLLASQSPSTIALSRHYLWLLAPVLWTNFGWSILQAQLRISAYNAMRLVTPLGYFAGTVIMTYTGWISVQNVIYLQMALAAMTLVLTVALVAMEKEYVTPLRSTRGMMRRLLHYGSRVQLGDFTQSANVQLDQVLISAWLPPLQLGLYSTAVSAGNIAQTIGKAIRPVLVAKVANAPDDERAISQLRASWRHYVLAGFVIVPTLMAVIPKALPLVYGRAFTSAIPSALILVAGSFLLGAKDVLGGAAQGLGRPWLNSKAEVGGFVITVAALPLALLYFGIVGAAIASCASYFVQLFIVSYGLRKSYRFNVMRFSMPFKRWTPS
jgi:O-antigen/teichoic acid export membrane protein